MVEQMLIQPRSRRVANGWRLVRGWLGSLTMWLALAAVAMAVTIGLSIHPISESQAHRTHHIEYLVRGSGNADLSLFSSKSTKPSAAATTTKAPLPWSTTFTVQGDIAIFSVTATARSTAATSIACQLLIDGRVVTAFRATGVHASVVCAGSGYDAR